ncbi:DUF1772 domain-containing protein [Jannaschia sp. 2305UL9-9]|uniref:anthrone oxygenase family protein n=1 Tax=Jannaschia sp. 2305UL9-9 TaxID=3121638 RepID=UPI0035283002
MSPFIQTALQAAVLAYAVLGGVFLAFSDFIMRSLGRIDGAGGIQTMQTINREVFRWVFMTVFIGMAIASLGIAVVGAAHLSHPSGGLILGAALAYLVGCFAVTVGFNVPMNEALAAMDVEDAATGIYWNGTYLPRWTAWNTVRAVSCVTAAALLLIGVSWMATLDATGAS